LLLGAPGSAPESWLGGAGSAAHEVERLVGGRLHDAALARAVEEARPNFRQCTLCGTWVCHQVCWNAQANLCEGCAPKFTEHLDKANRVNYVADVNMSANTYVTTPTAATNTQAAKHLCSECGAEVGAAKFCPECGKPVVQAAPANCPKCGEPSHGGKFCGNCGTKLVG